MTHRNEVAFDRIFILRIFPTAAISLLRTLSRLRVP
jgi:hypothetical protein